MNLQPGHTRTLGASITPDGVNFALAAPHADAVQLCLFDPQGRQELARHWMPACTDGIWHGRLALTDRQAATSLVYGWRVHGRWAPQEGLRYNPAKLMLDPCAREVVGRYGGEDIHRAHRSDDPARPDERDNAALALKARVVADLAPLAVARPQIDPARRVIYEMHVKGFTARCPDIPAELRGTYAGLAHPAALRHLTELGITTVCLLPVAQHADEERLLKLGLRNYWGYNPVAWNAPEAGYWSQRPGTSPRTEFRALVDALHAAGIEVVLDVVYNHTADTDELGPALSLRGIDNLLYYHLLPEDRRYYLNWTGCGNCVKLQEPLVLRAVMDSLRGWVSEFGVDGFRFDLAPVLARRSSPPYNFEPQAPFLAAVAQDPVLRERLMIAEPWDIGPDGYQLGAFPPGWLEWNDRFRDQQRGWWLQGQGSLGELATRLAGSSDVFAPGRRAPHSSVNFITAHDGFTLRDLVSYAQRHNEANGEGNRDGHGHNLSNNHGVEGETDRADVLARRAAQQRVLLAAQVLSLGTPMLQAGDELGHTQGGNNNAYCQDNPTTWLDWSHADRALLQFVQRLLALRQAHRALQSRHWWVEKEGSGRTVARWFTPQGVALTGEQWQAGGAGAMVLLLTEPDQQRRVLLALNGAGQPISLAVPPGEWTLQLDTHDESGHPLARKLDTSETLPGTCLWLAVEQTQTTRTTEPETSP